MKKKQIIALLMAGIMACSVPVAAKDINDMTLEELKVAYLELQLEYEKLKAGIAEKPEGETPVEEESDTVEEAVLMDEEEFKKDILEAVTAESQILASHSKSENKTMTYDEIVELNKECETTEWEYLGKYKNAKFEDLNIQYLCTMYVGGMEKIFKACDLYFNNNDIEAHNNYFDSGFADQNYVIVELSEYYNIPFPESTVTKAKGWANYWDSFNEAETRNAAVDHATVQNVQQLLNDIGFFCGSADGISGKRTVKSIKRFQEMYGYEPADGMIDDELVQQLTEVKEQKK